MEGICRYCGQVISVMADTQEEADRIAIESCTCPGARKVQVRNRKIENAKDNCDELFGADQRMDKVRLLMHELIYRMAEGEFGAVNIAINGRTSVKLSITSKGTIKVQRSDKEQKSLETLE